MDKQHPAQTSPRKPRPWFSAALLTLALALVPASAAQARTHPKVRNAAHALHHRQHKNGTRDYNKDDNTSASGGDIYVDTAGSSDGNLATATPEPDSGELVALGLVAGLAIVLARRSGGRSKSREIAAG